MSNRNRFGKPVFEPTPRESVVSIRDKVLTFYTKFYSEGNKRPRLQNLIQYQPMDEDPVFDETCDPWSDGYLNTVAGKYVDENGETIDLIKHEKQRPYNGYVSPGTKRRVAKYLETWVESVKTCKLSLLKKLKDSLPYFTFVTLSLSSPQRFDEGHDDKFIKKNLFVRFVEKMRKAGRFQHYFWRAEAQKNGNIHFHLIVDKYIPHEELRQQWNATQEAFGYIEPYRRKMLEKHISGFVFDASQKRFDKKTKRCVTVSYADQKRAYDFGVVTGWSQPNSTDIRKIQKVTDLTAYLLKYFTKNDKESRKIEGRIIGKSAGLEKLDTFCISEFDDSFIAWYNHARSLGCVEKEIDVIGNMSVVCVLGRFMASLRQHELKRKLIWFHLKKIRQLYPDIPIPEDIMQNPY